jgi:hypothetical protein
VLYELLAGQRPFSGDTQVAVLAAVLLNLATEIARHDVRIPWQLSSVDACRSALKIVTPPSRI